jgi:hypothetical protein
MDRSISPLSSLLYLQDKILTPPDPIPLSGMDIALAGYFTVMGRFVMPDDREQRDIPPPEREPYPPRECPPREVHTSWPIILGGAVLVLLGILFFFFDGGLGLILGILIFILGMFVLAQGFRGPGAPTFQ